MGLRLSPEKTLITHIDEGLDFLGWRIQRHRKRGTSKHYVYIYPAKKALWAITARVKTICWQDMNLPLDALLHQLNPVLRGWTAYFRYGVVEGHLQLPAGLTVEAGLWMVASQTRRSQPGRTSAAEHQRRMVARRQHGDSVQPGWSEDHLLFVPGSKDPQHRGRAQY